MQTSSCRPLNTYHMRTGGREGRVRVGVMGLVTEKKKDTSRQNKSSRYPICAAFAESI